MKAGAYANTYTRTLIHPRDHRQTTSSSSNIFFEHNEPSSHSLELYSRTGFTFYNHDFIIFFTITQWGSVSSCTHFTDEETEVQRDHVIHPRWCHMANNCQVQELKTRFIWHQSLCSWFLGYIHDHVHSMHTHRHTCAPPTDTFSILSIKRPGYDSWPHHLRTKLALSSSKWK